MPVLQLQAKAHLGHYNHVIGCVHHHHHSGHLGRLDWGALRAEYCIVMFNLIRCVRSGILSDSHSGSDRSRGPRNLFNLAKKNNAAKCY